MTSFNAFARQAIAALGALAITATLLVSSFATSPEMTAISGIIA